MVNPDLKIRPTDYLRRMRGSGVYNVAVRTPLELAPRLSRELGRKIWLKREDLQPSHSFKLRGAYQCMSCLSGEELDCGVIAASAGNHALGVAYAAQILGAKATIVVPLTTPEIKVQAIRELGAELIAHGDNFDQAFARTQEIVAERKLILIHPYDHPDVIVGQGTIGLEICDTLTATHEDLEAVFVPIGGGGLIAGVALAIKQIRPNTKIIGVEPVDSDAMTRSLERGERVTLPTVGLFADGLAVRRVGEETFEIAREWVDETITVTTDETSAAIKTIFEERRAIVEPSGAVGLAGLKKWAQQNPGQGSLATILSGANLNFDRLQFIAERARVGNRTEGILAVEIPDRPGAFCELCAALGERNVTEFNYRKSHPERAVVFAAVSIAGQADLSVLVDHLRAEGYQAQDLTDDEMAKRHVRHMIGGPDSFAVNERVFHVSFPERVGALSQFLNGLGQRWNISLFHYRNYGSDRGRALVGFEVPHALEQEFEAFLRKLDWEVHEETDNSCVRLFLQPDK